MVLVLGPVWSASQIVGDLPSLSVVSMSSGRVEPRTLVVGAHVMVLMAWLALVNEYVRDRRESRAGPVKADAAPKSKFRHWALWLMGAATVATGVGDNVSAQRQHESIPVGDAVTPALASAILTRIISRRREQIHAGFRPGRLDHREMETIAALVLTAESANQPTQRSAMSLTAGDCDALIEAVERVGPATEVHSVASWDVKVQLFGYPTVVASNGVIAEFRKKKALELLVWLVLNRDRTRRSAARTSLWEFAISDSTFSTVISDMRRALSGLGGAQTHQQWVPPTYSDVIPLSASIVSDHELLMVAHSRFQESDANATELANAIAEIRDIPFAGTNYLWADLDGTTTRLVIDALDACRDLARWALEQNRRSELDVAVSAALRVMPGCEEFLEMQNLYLSNSYSYRRSGTR